MEAPISESEWRSILKEALGGRTDFVIQAIASKMASDSAPMGFMARHLSLEATFTVHDGFPTRIPFFVKIEPSSEAHRDFLEEMQHFEKELVMYERALPAMSSALPQGVKLPFPRSFLARRGRNPLIVMEDLKKKGYALADKMKPFDRPHCLVVLHSLARFHGGALLVLKDAIEAKSGSNVDYAGGAFKVATDTILADGDAGKMSRRWVDSSVATIASAAAALWPERFLGDRQKVERCLRDAWTQVSKMAKPSAKHTNVVCHGDLWANNLMFRYDGGEPVDAKLVDLQLVRFSPPAGDILMFLHLSTTKSFRDEHAMGLFQAYHGYLEEIVGKAMLDKLNLSSSAFLESIREYALFGKLVSATWCSITLGSEEKREEGEPIDFATTIMRDRGQKVLSDARASPIFRQRVSESYEELLKHLGLWM